jgi:hypothetical protein
MIRTVVLNDTNFKTCVFQLSLGLERFMGLTMLQHPASYTQIEASQACTIFMEH